MSDVLVFGPFALDVAERRLTRGDRVVPLAPKALDLLVVLARHAGHLVTKSDLLDLVWPDTHVDEGILSVHVSALRKALGDRGREGRYIETVSRSGYRFTGDVVCRRSSPEVLPTRWPVGVLPASAEVHELIGRGRGHLATSSIAEIPKAAEAFEAAIGLDPTYAPAHAGLALTWCAKGELRLVSLADAYAAARVSALRALGLDASSADAQTALATVLFLADWNWAAARRSLDRALQVAPDHTEAWLLYGRLLEALGDLNGGLAAKRKALEQNPASARVQLTIALSYWHLRRYDDVIRWATRALRLDPRHLLAREYVAGAYQKKGDDDRYVEESLAHAASFGAPRSLLDELRQIYARAGRRGLMEYSLDLAARNNGPALQLAVLSGELGDLDNAFRHLDRAIDQRDPCLVDLAIGPQWDALRGDVRFGERLERIGLKDERMSE